MASKENLPTDTSRNRDSDGDRGGVKDDDSFVANCVDDMFEVSWVVDNKINQNDMEIMIKKIEDS